MSTSVTMMRLRAPSRKVAVSGFLDAKCTNRNKERRRSVGDGIRDHDREPDDLRYMEKGEEVNEQDPDAEAENEHDGGNDRRLADARLDVDNLNADVAGVVELGMLGDDICVLLLDARVFGGNRMRDGTIAIASRAGHHDATMLEMRHYYY